MRFQQDPLQRSDRDGEADRHLAIGRITLTADIQIATAVPNMHYDIRLIQCPGHPPYTCWGADPGVAQGSLNTDGPVAAAVTSSGHDRAGGDGRIRVHQPPGQVLPDPAEFYTTDFIAPI